jgi:toxin ParE1/3/4
MLVKLIWRPQAREDLVDIHVVIALDNPSASDRMLAEFEAAAGRLRDFPRLGVRRSDIRPGLRMLVVRPYLLLYETFPDTDDGPVDRTEIVRVVHGHRDLSRLF